MDTIQKKGKGQQDIIVGAMYRGACQHTAFKAGGNEMAQLSVAERGIARTSEEVHDRPQQTCQVEIRGFKMAESATDCRG